LYGEAVVKAAVENGANHVDISGEPAVKKKLCRENNFVVFLVARVHANEVLGSSKAKWRFHRWRLWLGFGAL
jgi:hypothetical protein